MARALSRWASAVKGSNDNIEYVERWQMMDQQAPHLTCFSAAKSIPCLLSASEDNTLLFVDIGAGVSLGIVDLENFYIQCAVWSTSSTLILGASNGVVYEMIINPKNELHPVSMSSIIGLLHQQIHSIGYDSSGVHRLLAVGHGTQVSVYVQTLQNHEWNKVDDILEPCHHRGGLVNSLIFFGEARRKLFVGYAEEGWTIWEYGTSNVRRFDPANYTGICRIGQARIGPGQETISITMLDQSIMVYCLGDNGPIIETGHEYPLQVPLASNPILPVEHTASGLILGGTSTGNVSIIKPSQSGNSGGALIRGICQGDGHLIRAVTDHGSHVLVGSTAPNNQVVIKCYTDVRKGISRDKRSPYKPFRLSLSDVLVMSHEGHKRTSVTIESPTILGSVIHSHELKLMLILMALMSLVILSSDPPGGESFRASHTPSLQKGVRVIGNDRHKQWVLFGLRYFARYASHQVGSWSYWMSHLVWAFTKHLIGIPIGIVKLALIAASQWMCERVEFYRELGVCPQIYYN